MSKTQNIVQLGLLVAATYATSVYLRKKPQKKVDEPITASKPKPPAEKGGYDEPLKAKRPRSHDELIANQRRVQQRYSPGTAPNNYVGGFSRHSRSQAGGRKH